MFEILYIVAMMLFLFGITIFVHEWGHFIVARKCGLVVESFSIGMGPALWKVEKDGIVYKIGAFPIGGYVALPQLDPEGMEKVQGDNAGDRPALPDVSPWKKIAVAVAGPLCNIIFALFLALIVFAFPGGTLPEEDGVFIADVKEESQAYATGLRMGDEINAINGNPVKSWYDVRVESLLAGGKEKPVELTVSNSIDGERTLLISVNSPEDSESLIDGVAEAHTCQIQQVVSGGAAEAAGLKDGDIIISIAGTFLQGTEHFIKFIQDFGDKTIPFVVKRNDEVKIIDVTPAYDEGQEKVMIGIYFSGALSMPWTLSGNPFEQVKSDASSIFRLLKALTTPGESKQAAGGLGGPIAIFTMIWMALKMGLINALGLIRFININLAVLNLLPLPVLDGGHICFALWEGTTRRKVHPKVVASLVNAFAILLIGAMLFLSWRDAERNWGISRIFDVFKKAPIEQVEVPAE
jgi:regulator of sigma E protease